MAKISEQAREFGKPETGGIQGLRVGWDEDWEHKRDFGMHNEKKKREMGQNGAEMLRKTQYVK